MRDGHKRRQAELAARAVDPRRVGLGGLAQRTFVADRTRDMGVAGREIGVAVAGLCNLINPERVIIGGRAATAAATRPLP